uniref:hyoscyamine 6-dioxygenase-like n=1 Tax=Erigeron canadensis TaxID=72917 RepID=UPI001CB8DF16|nr:hyoscyamine 6-dioxygenase-like [Erigeron canadensis]
MARLVSSWSKGVHSIPKDYIVPPERRCGDFVAVCKDIPVIDLQKQRPESVQQILKACQEFGVFQVVNHGLTDKMMADMRVLYDEFFNMPVEEKLDVYSDKPGECVLSTTTSTSTSHYAKEHVLSWRDTLIHPCLPLEKYASSWPNKPVRYRKEVGRYAAEMRKLGFKILNLIGEGLELDIDYFKDVSQKQTMVINHYPLCPDPSLAMGADAHTDPNVITILQQDQYGLQVLKDGKWIGVEPISNAFVVNLGYQLQVISNGKLKSVEHRAVLNSTAARTSISTFFSPGSDLPIVIEPAKELVTLSSPQMFKSYQFSEFQANYLAYMSKPVPRNGTPLDPYRL